MAVYRLTRDLVFPPPERASRDGLVAVGGDTRPERLVLAYSQGIFPWPHQGLPLLWFSPNPRFVIHFDHVHIGRSLRKRARAGDFEIRVDTAFAQVLEGCSNVPRPGQDGTWITDEIREGYTELHKRGLAHSIEAWRIDDATGGRRETNDATGGRRETNDATGGRRETNAATGGRLVGGLYGVSLGKSFCGESMFALEPDASKVAMLTLLGNLSHWGFHFVDCQVFTEHLARFGAHELPREEFLKELRVAVAEPSRLGPWQFDLDPVQALKQLASVAASAASP